MTDPTTPVPELDVEAIAARHEADCGKHFAFEIDKQQLYKDRGDLLAALRSAREEIERLKALVYVPGVWRCAKCEFRLLQSNLNAATGQVTARNDPGDTCPNCNSPLWRVSERQERVEAQNMGEWAFLEADELRKQLTALRESASKEAGEEEIRKAIFSEDTAGMRWQQIFAKYGLRIVRSSQTGTP